MSQDPPATLDEPDTDAEVIAKLRAEIERLTAEWRAAQADSEWLRHELAKEANRFRADDERLLAAIRRIDGINDNPVNYNSEINAVCDSILRPHLACRDELWACDAVWARFYRDGKTLGEIAREFDCWIYDLSPWLTAPIARAALAAKDKP